MKSKKNITSRMKLWNSLKNNILLLKISALIVTCLLFLGSCTNNVQDTQISSETTTISTSAEATTVVPADVTASISETTKEYANEFLKELDENFGRFYDSALFYDIDLDGHMELILEGSNDRSFSTKIYSVYKLNNEIPEYYGRIDLESSDSRYTEHTICEGKLQRYYDNDKGVYFIISDSTQWDDGSFGHVQYYTYKNILYSDIITNETIAGFSGTDCALVKDVKAVSDLDISFDIDNDLSFYSLHTCLYYDGIFDLNGSEKFVNISKETEQYDFVDEVNLKELTRYTDIDEIAELITNYSGYQITNAVLSPSICREYIEINKKEIRKDASYANIRFDDISKTDLSVLAELEKLECIMLDYYGDEEINLDLSSLKNCKSLTSVILNLSKASTTELKQLCDIENLTNLTIWYFEEDQIDFDLSPLKKCKNLTSIYLPYNISESTKQQISELTKLETVNGSDITIKSEDDYQYLKDLPNLKYIAISSTSDNPDYFSFLYSNQSIEWIRFDKSVTKQQIMNVLNNMPNIEAVTFGFSEV